MPQLGKKQLQYTYCPACNPHIVQYLEILGNMCIVIVFQSGCDVKNFEINLIFLIKTFSLYDKKVKTKLNSYILEIKKAYKMK